MLYYTHYLKKLKLYCQSVLLLVGFVLTATGLSHEGFQWDTPDPILPVDNLRWSSDADGAVSNFVSGQFNAQTDTKEVQFDLPMPDGRLDIEALELGVLEAGTIEWWVQPRPSIRLWRNAGWHYFLHLRPEHASGLQLDLWRHPRTDFRLSASRGMKPFNPVDYPPERIQIKTDKLDEAAWQQIIVSWDLSTDPQRIGLLVNGSGQVINLPAGTFKPGRVLSMEFGNRPSTWEVPYLPMGGAIKKIGIYDASIFDR